MISKSITIILALSASLSAGDVVFPDGSKGAQSPAGFEPHPPVGRTRPATEPHTELASFAHDPAHDGSESTQLADDPGHPQARFFGLFGGKKGGLFGGGGGLFGGGIGGLFCKSCSFQDPIKADRCCKKGEIECCAYSQFGGSFGSGFGGPVPPGIYGGGFDKVDKVGPPGYGPGFAGSGFGGGGFGGGGFGGGGFGGGTGLKQGYCPRATLFNGIGNLFKLRDGEVALDDPNKPISLDDHHKNDFSDAKRRALRQVKFEDTVERLPQDEHVTNSDEPTQRFLPIFSGLPNPLCRDQCFNDYDCPSALKCCINFGNCRECSYPRFDFF